MPKQSGLLKRIQAQRMIERKLAISFAVQRVADCAVITLHNEFGFGAERNKRFMEQLNATLAEMADMVEEDDKTDKELIYSRAKLDAAVKEAMGEHFVKWEERYP